MLNLLFPVLLSCSTDGSATEAKRAQPSRQWGTRDSSSGGDTAATGDSAPTDDTTTGEKEPCRVEPGDGWSIAPDGTALVFAHRGNVDLTVSDAGTRIGSGPIASDVVGGSNVYIDGRLGVETNYWMKQPYGAGAAFSTATGNDHYALYAENESGDANSVESVSVYGAATTARTSPRVNVAGWFTAANAPGGNIGARVDAQYSPDASPPNQTLQLREMSGDTPLYVGYYNPNYIDARDGAYGVTGFDVRINGTPVATFTQSGVYAEDYQVWSSKTLKTDIVALSDSDRAQLASEVQGIQVVRFRYRDDVAAIPHVGLIAEDAPRGIVDADGRAVRLPETVAYLVAANQELASENVAMRADLDALRRQVEALKPR